MAAADHGGFCIVSNYDPSAVYGLTARGEYFADKDGVAGFGTDIIDLLYLECSYSNLTDHPEFR
jgi:hypothetical protein